MSIDLLKIENAWKIVEGFPQPDWRSIREYIKQHYPVAEHPDIWHEVSLQWVGAIRDALGPEYTIHQSRNFLILTTKTPAASQYTLTVCENVLAEIRCRLGTLAWRWKNGKHVVLIFDDLELYYRYISYFYPEEGEFSGSGGMFLNRGYCHTALPPRPETTPALIHEFTHLSLAHLRIPRWLNEGLAVNTEISIRGSRRTGLDAELMAAHDNHWNSETIQDFWNGKSFFRPKENKISYSLAQILVANLQNDYRKFGEFVQDASRADAGESSAQKHLGVGLNAIASVFLGEGQWSPKSQQDQSV